MIRTNKVTRAHLVELERQYYETCNPYDLHAIKPLLKALMRKHKGNQAKAEALRGLIRDARKHPLKVRTA
jgi:DNA-binding protein Fis